MDASNNPSTSVQSLTMQMLLRRFDRLTRTYVFGYLKEITKYDCASRINRTLCRAEPKKYLQNNRIARNVGCAVGLHDWEESHVPLTIT